MYLVTAELINFAAHHKVLLRMELATSAPAKFIDEWLVEHKLPRLSSWSYDGQTGSNSPGEHHGVLNTLYLKTRQFSERLVITLHELVPVDPTTVF